MVAQSQFMDAAPSGPPVPYDQRNLALYAALLHAHEGGRDWRWAVSEVMSMDPTRPGAELCWRSHLDRARWITTHGLEDAIAFFGQRDR